MPVGYDVVQLLDTPIEIRQPAITATVEYGDRHSRKHSYSNGNEEPELEELILDDGTWQ